MAYKTILTVFRSDPEDRAHLDAAAGLADQLGAHLHVMALGTERFQAGAYYAGADAVAIQAALDQARRDADAARTVAEARLKPRAPAFDVSTAAAQIGGLSQIVGRRAMLSDLVVLPKPYGEGRTHEDAAIVEAALFLTGTPVLILPPGHNTAPSARQIIVGWNQSREALAAIRAALPVLAAADHVDIAIIDPPVHDIDRSDPGGLLAEMLSRHGIHADITVLARTMPRISDVLLRHARDTGADMVVMGAYGHSRLREAVLGGATRDMLEKSTIPVLMTH